MATGSTTTVSAAHVRELLAGISSNTRMIEQLTTAVELIRQRTARLEEEVYASMPTHPQRLLPGGWQVVKRAVPGRYLNAPKEAEWWLQRLIQWDGRAYWEDVSGPYRQRSAAIEAYVRMHAGAILAGPMPPDEEGSGDPSTDEPAAGEPEDDYNDC